MNSKGELDIASNSLIFMGYNIQINNSVALKKYKGVVRHERGCKE